MSEVEAPSQRNVETEEPSEMVEERTRGIESRTPPVDDRCAICLGDTFTVPCRTSCGHWYCGGCILKWWNCGAVLQPCKCPICLRQISRLTLETSLHLRQEEKVTEVLENVRKYNCRFDGDTSGVVLSGDQHQRMLLNWQFTTSYVVLLLLSILYKINSFEFIPLGHVGITTMFYCCAVALAIIIFLVGNRRLLRRRVRRRLRLLAAS
uniref:RING-type domain-containing protein n=1 Tax=Davidia involucrata TaxID=16924 RepID=A0A5B7BMC8_DAVIN